MAENKPTNRERLREITDGIEQGIKELFESEKYMRYLSVMSRFHRSRLVGLFSAMIFSLLSKCVISAVCSAIHAFCSSSLS